MKSKVISDMEKEYRKINLDIGRDEMDSVGYIRGQICAAIKEFADGSDIYLLAEVYDETIIKGTAVKNLKAWLAAFGVEEDK